MSVYLGDFPTSAVVYAKFATNLATGARADPNSAWEAADVRVYKAGSTTERSSTAGFTVTSTFDSMTGITHVAIDTSDNTDAGFYAAGSEYQIVLYPDETVDSVAISHVIAHFSIERAGGVLALLKAGTFVIKNATFNADVGSTAIATNVIGIAAAKGVVNELNVATYAEPAQGAPPATTTLVYKIGLLYKNLRNRKLQTSTLWSLLNDDAATVDHKAAVADDGTTASKAEIASGP